MYNHHEIHLLISQTVQTPCPNRHSPKILSYDNMFAATTFALALAGSAIAGPVTSQPFQLYANAAKHWANGTQAPPSLVNYVRMRILLKGHI